MPTTFNIDPGTPDPSGDKFFDRMGASLQLGRENSRADDAALREEQAHETRMRQAVLDMERKELDIDIAQEQQLRSRERHRIQQVDDELGIRGKQRALDRLETEDERDFIASLADMPPAVQRAALADAELGRSIGDKNAQRRFYMQRSVEHRAAFDAFARTQVMDRIQQGFGRGAYGNPETTPGFERGQAQLEQIVQGLEAGILSPREAAAAEEKIRGDLAAETALMAGKVAQLESATNQAAMFRQQGMPGMADLMVRIQAKLQHEIAGGEVGNDKTMDQLLEREMQERMEGDKEMARQQFLSSARTADARMKLVYDLGKALGRPPTVDEVNDLLDVAEDVPAEADPEDPAQPAAPGGLRPIDPDATERILGGVPGAAKNAPAAEQAPAQPKSAAPLSKKARTQRR
jgi:hypothetical protein